MDRPDNSSDCCADEACDSGRRNRYFPHKRFTPDTWTVEQNYHVQRRHLLNRAVHGWGVVYGFATAAVTAADCSSQTDRHLEIEQGLALDPCGRELLWVGSHCADPWRIDLDDILALDCDGKLISEPGKRCRGRGDSPWNGGDAESCWLLSVHYAERLISPVNIPDPCNCEQQEWDQVCETVRFSLRRLKSCDQCCRRPECGLHCECADSHCCPGCAEKPAERGGCRCLCEHLTELDPTPECCTLSTVCRGLKVDLRHGVPLACITLQPDECDDWTIGAVKDDCGPRRLVKRNDLLFDLIRGRDLAHISEVSWHAAHRKTISFKDFRNMFGTPDSKGANVTDFRLRFSRPVQTDTITPDAFSLTVIARDDGDGWGRTLRIPVVAVRHEDVEGCHAKGATILVDSDWAKGAFDDYSVFGLVTRFEFRVFGDLLLDCNGLAVDCNTRGPCAAPTGNGVPGDTFFSTFLVQAKEAGDHQDKSTYVGI